MSELPPGWAKATTGALFTFVTSGSRGWARYYSDEGAPFIRVGNLRRASITLDLAELQRVSPPAGAEGVRTEVEPDDILISITADLGRIALAADLKETTYINQHVALARPVRAISPRYVAWYLSSDVAQRQWGEQQRGVTRLGLGLEDIRSVEIPIPPLAEQERIVAAVEEQFSRLDAGVAALERARQNLKRMRAAVLQAAVTGGLVRQIEGPAAAMQLVTQLRSEARVRGTRKTAAPAIQYLGSIPDSWQVVALADLAESIDYGTSEKTRADVKGVPVLRMGNLGWGTIAYNDLKFLPREQLDPRLLLQRGDLLFNRTNSAELVGKTAVFHGYPEDIAFASYLIRARPLPSANLEWANIVLNSPIGRRYVAGVRNQQVGQANVNGTKLAAAPIPLPSAEEQSRIIAECELLFSLIDTLEDAAEAATCRSERLRSSILSTAFAGELVAQDSTDEPASALLERIAAERASSNGRSPARTRKPRTPQRRSSYE